MSIPLSLVFFRGKLNMASNLTKMLHETILDQLFPENDLYIN